MYDLITIIVPCYNAADKVTASIESIISQTYKHVEIIAVDDGSSDNTLLILKQLSAKHPNLKVLHQKNKGPGPARNNALAYSTGKYIAFLDADDYWDARFLEKLYTSLVNTNADLAYCGWHNIGAPGNKDKPFIPPDYSSIDRAELFLGGNRWPIHAVLSKSELIKNAGGFDETFFSSEDYDLWLRTAPFCHIVFVPEVLAFYRHHEGPQITKNVLRVSLEHYDVQVKFIRDHPDIVVRLGKRRVREIIQGGLLKKAYKCYWDRDTMTAQILFRKSFKNGYFCLKDLKYLLPSLLPQILYRKLIQYADS